MFFIIIIAFHSFLSLSGCMCDARPTFNRLLLCLSLSNGIFTMCSNVQCACQQRERERENGPNQMMCFFLNELCDTLFAHPLFSLPHFSIVVCYFFQFCFGSFNKICRCFFVCYCILSLSLSRSRFPLEAFQIVLGTIYFHTHNRADITIKVVIVINRECLAQTESLQK